MWRLTLKQEKELGNELGNIFSEQEVVFEDENQNNLLDLIRYLSECKVPRKTWFELKELKEDAIPTTIYNRGGR